MPSLAGLAAERLRARRTRGFIDPESVDFLGCVPKFSPHLVRPYWLAPLADVLRRAFLASAGLCEPVRACVSVPSQHGKTSEIEAAIIEWLCHRPQDQILYVTYNEDTARDRGREFRDLARVAGLKLRDDSRSIVTWDTPEGGGLRCRAISGQITGMKGLRFIVIDDPYKDRPQAESAAIRRTVQQSFTGNIISRLHPTTSLLVNHTRWVESDLIGWLKREQAEKWEFVNLPAINDAGEPLWPEGQPLSLLNEKRAYSEYDWWSIYMGQPRSRDGKTFQGLSFYDPAKLPSHMRVAIGVDLAYTSRTNADWSVAVVLGEAYGQYYVLDVVRRQCAAPEFAVDLKRLAGQHQNAPMVAYVGNAERGAVDFLRSQGVPLVGRPALTDKLSRALPLSNAWNGNPAVGVPPRVHVPNDSTRYPWVGPYTSVLLDFSPTGAAHDDDVDATAAAFDALPQVSGPVVTVPQGVVEQRPRRDPAISSRGRGRASSW